jgi:hypothetical protein
MLVQRISYLCAASKKPEAAQMRRLARDDKGGEQQIGTAERILAEIISSDVAQLVTARRLR